jgi:hypothetical protein
MGGTACRTGRRLAAVVNIASMVVCLTEIKAILDNR